jgi:membrane-associated phospholipid phosphatase
MPATRDRLGRATGPLLALAVACAIAVVLLFVAFVHTERGQRWDDRARGDLSAQTNPRAYHATDSLLQTISVSALGLLGAGIMAVALVRRRPRLAVAAGVLVLGANLITQAMKRGFDRPDLVHGGVDPGAFPSGHTTVATSLAMGLVLVVPRALRWGAAIAGGAYAIGVGVAVVALEWHRPSEVIAAYLVTVGWACLVAAVVASPAGRGELADRAHTSPGAIRLAGLAGAALALAFVAVVAVDVAGRVDLVRVVADRTAFAAAAAICAAAAIVLVGAGTHLVQRAAGSRPPEPG